MKKFLLSLAAAMLACVSVSAETSVVYDFVNNTYGLTRQTDNSGAYIDKGTVLTENDGVTVTLTKTDDKNGWRLWSDGLRVYKNSGSGMTINAGTHTITAVVFEMAKTSIVEGYTVDGGAEVTVSTQSFTVSCDASEVNIGFTVTSNNGALATMTVVLDGTPGETPEVTVPEVASLTEFVNEQPTVNTKITGTVTVTYQSPDKVYTFITDGTSSLEVYLYGGIATEYKNGDQLTGIIGKYSEYYNMPQMVPYTDSFVEATVNEEVAPEEVTLDKVQLNQYVVVKGVDIVANESSWDVTDGTTTLAIYNRFSIDGIEALEGATITGIGAVYDETLQIFPITIEGGTTPDEPEDSISEISAAANGAVEIYNLAGQRLNAPVKGINIINGQKVLVK